MSVWRLIEMTMHLSTGPMPEHDLPTVEDDG
jgi:hypothetical protein